MGNCIAGLIAGLFIGICFYCWPYSHHAKLVTIWRDEKSATRADVYGITPDEVEKPIKIWGE